MAILKHLTNKSSNYGKALEYLMYQHNEFTQKPVLDDNGNMQLREELYLDGLNCQPLTFSKECEKLNAQYHKNQKADEVKSHHYIISFDPKDIESGLTGEKAQEIGLEFARKFFDGHQALVCTHTDGHNHSGNIHVHIVINSLRKHDVAKEDFMERDYDCRAGYKHHQTRKYLTAMQEGLMSICKREHLHQVDLISPAADKMTDREYRLNQRKQIAAEKDSNDTKPFQSQKNYMQDAIREVSSYAQSPEQFGEDLKKYYGIKFKSSRGRFSYLHPDRQKYMTERTLGNDYSKAYLMPLFDGNKKTGRTREQMLESISTSAKAYTGDQKYDKDDRPPYDPSYDYNADPIAVLHFQTKLRLVVDLQSCVKAQASRAYARKVKMTNIQQMAQTICYVQEHGYDTKDDLEHDRQMNIVALNRLKETIKYISDQISDIENGADGNEQNKARLEVLQKTKDNLITNQANLKQSIKDLQIVASNVDAILNQKPDHSHKKERTQDLL